MAISDDQYLEWLRADRQRRVVLAEATYYPPGGPAATRYFSTAGFVSGSGDTPANQDYIDIIKDVPVFTARMSEIFSGPATSGWGDVVIINENGDRDAWLDDAWDGRALTLLLGDESWERDDFRSILTGVSADIVAVDRNRLALRARDKEWQLNVPLQKNLVGGSTDNADRLKPVCYGQCFNVSPVLDDTATHRYLVHDGAIEDITDVRDNGVTVGYTKDLSNGRFTLTAAPSGQITADVKGAKPSSYLVKPGDIVSNIITARTTLTSSDLDSTSFSDFNTTCPQTMGFYATDYLSASAAIDELLASVGAFRAWSRDGKLYLGQLGAPAGTPDLELTADDVGLNGLRVLRRLLPVKTARLGYKKNYTAQREGLAGAVSEANRAAYGREFRTKKATNASVDTTHLLAQHPPQTPTLIAGSADAQTEVDRLAALYDEVRYVYEVRGFVAPLTLRLGQTVQLTHPRFGFEAGKLGVIVGFSEFPTRGRATLELFA